MTRVLTLTMICLLALSVSAPLGLAQDSPDHDGHDHGDGSGHAHDHPDHGDHDVDPGAHDADIDAALASGGALIEVDVLGMVCDFCATALTKTFGRRDEVAAVHVDLDTKRLSVVVKEGATLDDGTLTRLVESAGYKVKRITRITDAPDQGAGE